MRTTKIDNPRLLLAQLREGDFAHAGDREAIDIVLAKIVELIGTFKPSMRALDVGCGLGGTAAYIKGATLLDVDGIDVDRAAIKHAQSKYSTIRFVECDAMNVDKQFSENSFDLIYLFNVFYAIPKQQESLRHLAAVGKAEALLVIFDYTRNDTGTDFDLKDLAGKPMKPVGISDLKNWLQVSGWDLISIVDLASNYARWYGSFLELLSEKKEDLLKVFSEEAFLAVQNTFSTLLAKLKSKEISGSAIYAKLNKNRLFKDGKGLASDQVSTEPSFRAKF